MVYAKHIENNIVTSLMSYDFTPDFSDDPNTIIITEEEYNALLSETREKSALEDALYCGEITLDDVPEEWREEIEQAVNDRIATEGTADEQEISDEEALNIILGGTTA